MRSRSVPPPLFRRPDGRRRPLSRGKGHAEPGRKAAVSALRADVGVARTCRGATGRRGQVVVEIMLALPVFLFMVFLIMEVGYIAFQTLLTQHAAYECARIGSMLAGEITKPELAPHANYVSRARSTASDNLAKMMRTARFTRFEAVKTLTDPQTGRQNYDLVVEVTNRAKLIFPFSAGLLSTPRGTCCRNISAVVRMPIENPAPYTLP